MLGDVNASGSKRVVGGDEGVRPRVGTAGKAQAGGWFCKSGLFDAIDLPVCLLECLLQFAGKGEGGGIGFRAADGDGFARVFVEHFDERLAVFVGEAGSYRGC